MSLRTLVAAADGYLEYRAIFAAMQLPSLFGTFRTFPVLLYVRSLGNGGLVAALTDF